MRFIKELILLVVVIISVIPAIYSQSLPDTVIKKIDNLYIKWNNNTRPGCTIGIVMNDKLIYSKGYGLANLEYAVPNEPETIYHMASVSKQFTAWSILLLARAGKLQLEDDIHKYLPWFPDLKEKITVRNLLNHTSGIRDQWQLLAISGTRIDDVITQDHIVKILGRQQALNFKSGEKYSYSNSGFTMLAEIVKSVTGQTLRKFTDSAIFKPLGMNNTHFHDDYTEIVKNRSYSYFPADSAHFTNSILSYSNAGATSLFTNINDMSKWVMNFFNPDAANQEIIAQLTQKGKLNNGKELSYACGISVSTYEGWKQFSHSGGDAGYRTFVTVFPDLKMGFIVFSNSGDFDAGGRAYEMAALFIKDTTQKKVTEIKEKKDSSSAIIKDSLSMLKYLGNYIGEEGLPFSFDIKEKKLYYHIYGETNFLVRESADTYSVFNSPEIKFKFGKKANTPTVDVTTPDEFIHLARYVQDSTKNEQLLKSYEGTYYSAELDCKYGIVLKDHQLMLTNNKYDDVKLTLLTKDHFTNDHWWMNHLMIIRDSKNQVSGFEVNSGRIMHLRFNKLR